MKATAIALLVVGFALAAWWFRWGQFGVWDECRAEHSWSYCQALMQGSYR